MIQKLDKNKKVIDTWDTVEEAAKAIKLSPAVLKKHLKGKPPKLGGFVFVERALDLLHTESSKVHQEIYTSTITEKDFADLTKAMHQNPSPEPAILLDEFGEVVTQGTAEFEEALEKALGHTGIPGEMAHDLMEMGQAAYHQDGDGKIRYVHPLSPEVTEVMLNAEVNPDWLLTPMQRRLKKMQDAKNS
jgi:hypothetical protein